MGHLPRLTTLLLAIALLAAGDVCAGEIRVMTSGAFAAAHLGLSPRFEEATRETIVTVTTSTGVGTDSIPSRIQRGEAVDVVILPDAALDQLVKNGLVVAGSNVALARSAIGMAVRAGAPKPDISSVDALKRALLQAESVAYSASVSGEYLSTELFLRLGIVDEMKPKSLRIDRERVGAVVARGEAEIGFQQISELLPIPGIDYVGPLPPEVQRLTVISAGVAVAAKNPEGARRLIQFFASPEAKAALTKVGLEPVVAQSATTVAKPVTLSAPSHHFFDDRLAREPMVVEHPSGALFVAGYGMATRPTNVETPNLWKSTDDGKTWNRVNVGTTEQGALGNSDVDLAVANDGTLYFVSMTFDNKVNEGVNINIGVSHDVGVSWTWTQLSNTRWDDRPWVEVAPDGTAHVIWNDGEGVSHAVSVDRGKTWIERPKIHPQGGSSHLAVGPNNQVAVRITPVSASGFKHHPDVELVAISSDGGNTWQKHPAPGKRTWTFPFSNNDPSPRWVEPLAWDASGALYHLWTEPGTGLRLARWREQQKTWDEWLIVEAKDATAFFPYLAARGKGELAATWFTAKLPDYSSLRTHVARIQVGSGDAAPQVRTSPPLEIDATTGKAPTPAGEYVPAIFLRNGRLAVVTPIQNRPAKRLGFTFWLVD